MVLLIVVPSLTQADDDLSPILAGSTGSWNGQLYYLDYQSGRRFGIPMRVDAELTPDGATMIRNLTFTDPGNLVHAVNLVTVDRDSGELVEAYFRQGKGEMLRYEIVDARYGGEREWQLVYEQDGTDDDRPARIRHTIERKGNELNSTKEVRFLDDDEYFLRNGTELTLVDAD